MRYRLGVFPEEVLLMKKREFFLLIKISLVCFLVTFFFACGYSFSLRGESIDSHIQRIYVEPFVNKTSQAELENYFRTAFINLLLQNSRFKVVNDAESADAVIRGKVVNFYTASLARRQNNLAAEERAVLVLEASFQDIVSGKEIWSAKSLTDSVDYSLSDDINVMPTARKQALMKLANDMAEKAFNLMMSGF